MFGFVFPSGEYNSPFSTMTSLDSGLYLNTADITQGTGARALAELYKINKDTCSATLVGHV